MKKLTFFLLFICLIMSVEAQNLRKKISLNDSSWAFIKQDVPLANNTVFDDSKWLKIKIPHDWNGGVDGVNNDVFTGPTMYMGPGFYRSRFTLGGGFGKKRLSITFEAVSIQADVWLNGNYIGNHKGGYTAFSFDITDKVIINGENVLVVKASNANDPGIAPWMKVPYGAYPNSSDYAVYGGIYRDVWLTVTDSVRINSEKHSSSNVSETSADITINTKLQNFGRIKSTVTLVTEINDATGKLVNSSSKEIALDLAIETNVEQIIKISQPILWSISKPYLYKVKSRLIMNSVEIDQLETELGIRSYSLKNGGSFKLNGQPLLLKGINRHQDRKGFGYAQSNKQHTEDMELIKSLGFNFLRHAHYPCDESVLEACDRLGILVWLEIPVSTCVSPDTTFLINARSQMREMINEHYNHPSVIVWGMGNESDQSTASTEAYTNTFFKDLNKVAHEADATRPTTGCNFKFASNQAIPDIYSPQDWTGWYSGNYTSYKPTQMIGEYGADTHIPSHNEKSNANSSTKPWIQEYACRLHEYKASVGEASKDLFPGHLVWVAFDFASPRLDRSTNPIPYMNQKGLISHDHKDLKDVAYFYKSYYTKGDESPMIYIVSKTWRDRIKTPGKYNIWAYSNCDSVVLFNGFNKNPLGTRTRNAGPSPKHDTRFQWDEANITDSILFAVGYVKGVKVISDTLIFNSFEPADPISSVKSTKNDDSSDLVSYPAPFDDMVKILFYVPHSTHVNLTIIDSTGKTVQTLVNKGFSQGQQFAEWNASSMANGIYFCQLKFDKCTKTIKLIKK